VAIVSAGLARAVFPGLDPLGQELTLPGVVGSERVTIVGVAQDVVQRGLDVPPTPQVYRPLAQWGSPLDLVVRTTGEPAVLVKAIRHAVEEIDPEQALSRVITMERALSDSVAPRRFSAMLLGLFAGVALVLAAVGLYGVTAHLVTQRTHEIGVRMALGARQRDVMQLVVRQAMRLVAVGTVLGLTLALGVSRVVRTLLYQVSPTDPLTFVSMTMVLIAVAALASWLPARRATQVDPMVALRSQ
jgi:putative ABC transport system permease protein